MKKIVDASGFTWGWCVLCNGVYVECSVCGNNCCNGSTGKLDSGENCGCSVAYEHQDKAYEEDCLPKFEDFFGEFPSMGELLESVYKWMETNPETAAHAAWFMMTVGKASDILVDIMNKGEMTPNVVKLLKVIDPVVYQNVYEDEKMNHRKTVYKQEFVNPPGTTGPCVNCGVGISKHIQDMNEPDLFVCPVIHFLGHGVTACNMSGLPCDWGDEHLWSEDWEQVNCESCLLRSGI